MTKRNIIIRIVSVIIAILMVSSMLVGCMVDIGEVEGDNLFADAIRRYLEEHLADHLRNNLTDEELRELLGDLFQEELDRLRSEMEDKINNMQAVITVDDIRQLLQHIDLTEFLDPNELQALMRYHLTPDMIDDLLSYIDLAYHLNPNMILQLLYSADRSALIALLNDVFDIEELLSELLSEELIRESIDPQLLRDIITGDMITEALLGDEEALNTLAEEVFYAMFGFRLPPRA